MITEFVFLVELTLEVSLKKGSFLIFYLFFGIINRQGQKFEKPKDWIGAF